MEIFVIVKSVYGRQLIYPNCEISRKLAELAAVKTFNAEQIAIVKSLGYTLTVVVPEL